MKLAQAQRVRQELARLITAGLDPANVTREVKRQLRSAVPFERACWHNVDPATAIVTNVLGDSALDVPLLGKIEYADDDVNKYVGLAVGPRRAATLLRSTEGTPHRSRRYREVLYPMRLEDELTISFVDASTFWGCARLYRARGQPPFLDTEVAYLAALSRLLAQIYRNALLAGGDPDMADPQAEVGVVVLDAHDEIDTITPTAEKWLADLVDIPRDPASEVPHPPHALAAPVRAEGRVADGTDGKRSRVRTGSGTWLTIEGSPLRDSRGDRVAIVLTPAPPAQIAPLVIDAYGLTQRERDVVRHVAFGRSNKEIATALGV